MKKLLFYALALTFALGVVSCQDARNRTVVNELNRSFPIYTGAGMTLLEAEALPDNVIKIHGEMSDPIFDTMDSAMVANLSAVMRNAMVEQASQSRALRDIGANIVYEFTTLEGKIITIEISADEIKNAN